MKEHGSNTFAQMFPTDWFDIVDGIPVVKQPKPDSNDVQCLAKVKAK